MNAPSRRVGTLERDRAGGERCRTAVVSSEGWNGWLLEIRLSLIASLVSRRRFSVLVQLLGSEIARGS